MDYTIALTAAELQLVSHALGQLPYNSVAALMLKIGGQAADQEEKEKKEKGK